MKTILLPLLALILLPSVASGQSKFLRLMEKQAGVIAHVKILNPLHGMEINSVGAWDTPVALCIVVEPIKGNLKKGELIRFSYNRSKSHRGFKSEANGKHRLVDLMIFDFLFVDWSHDGDAQK